MYLLHGSEQTLQSDLEGDGERDADCAGDLLFLTGERDLRKCSNMLIRLETS